MNENPLIININPPLDDIIILGQTIKIFSADINLTKFKKMTNKDKRIQKIKYNEDLYNKLVDYYAKNNMMLPVN